ncbi:MAG: CotH kinase family protein [Ruminiclostridium sp.]|nr:CotH kinase family protein [Ruminiclostridium sp.]
MSTSRIIDRICIIAIVLTVAVSILFCNAEAFGMQRAERKVGYEDRLFDNSRVHTIDLVVDDWEGFLENCENEEYVVCSALIDGESYRNIALRAKGNTSLSSVKQSGSSRYSFKLEFDHYDSTKTYHGLDKLCLNNIIQDNSYMKDYLAYTLMREYGADAPLCSYAYITVNNEDWGLYLAVEAVEDSFLQRNYGNDYGDLYKPDSLSFGGGRGNGKEFNMTEFIAENTEESESSDSISGENADTTNSDKQESGGFTFPGGDFSGGGFSGGGFPGGDFSGGNFPDMSGFSMDNVPGDFTPPSDFDPSSMTGESSENGDREGKGGFGGFGGFGFGGMGNSDVKLQYIDDDPDSYPNIFDSAKTPVSTADKNRLIGSLKTISEGGDVTGAVDIDEVIRYFAVHVFLCNGDSYTGMMVHNYYLYEDNGELSMIPWDYNLAYGTFQGSDATSSVNSPIDTPVSGGMSDRPMIAWIFGNEEYTQKYHEILSQLVENTDFEGLVNSTYEMIAGYVSKDPTKFCTYEDFEKGVSAIREFCTLRAESVKGQLDGTIPSTTSGQSADSSALIDASGLSVSDMGGMGGGNGGGGFGGFGGGNGRPGRDSDSTSERGFGRRDRKEDSTSDDAASSSTESATEINESSGSDSGSAKDFDPSSAGFGGGSMPEGFDPSSAGFVGGIMPEGFDPSSAGFGGGSMPEGFPGDTASDSTTETADTENNNSTENTGSSDKRPSSDTAGNRQRPGVFTGTVNKGTNTGNIILLAVCGGVLLVGIVFAAVFRRRRR